MFDQIFQLGVAQGMGIFFFLFVVACAVLIRFLKYFMQLNEKRENRYIETIDKLAEIHDIKDDLIELRRDVNEGNIRQEKMLGRLLDRLPPNQ